MFINLFIYPVVDDFILEKRLGKFLRSSRYSSRVMSRERKAKAWRLAGQGRTSKSTADGCHERGEGRR